MLLLKILQNYDVTLEWEGDVLYAYTPNHRISFYIVGENFTEGSAHIVIHMDQIKNSPEKIAALILSKLKLNKTIYARSCEIKRVDKKTAVNFFETYHLMNSTKSAFNFGLYYKNELIALASFSKGRKMNRLREEQRSFELIRFCSRSGITVTGGLSKLLKNFCKEKNAGDIMTYVDKQLSDGSSFVRAGFKKYSETEPNYFLINKITFERTCASKDEIYDPKKFYLTPNAGNVKLVFVPPSALKND